MSNFSRVSVITEFVSEHDGIVYGVYQVVFKGKHEIFIRNGDSIGAVTFLWGKTASQCVSEIRADVKEEFYDFWDNCDKNEDEEDNEMEKIQ